MYRLTTILAIASLLVGCSGTDKEPTSFKRHDHAVIFLSESPDDGPGYTLAFGRGPASLERCDHAGSYGKADQFRMFPAGAYVLIRVAADQTRTLPAQIDVARGQHAEALRCSEDDRCETAKAGEVELVELAPGVRARGSYRLELAGGTDTASFEATWCGPRRP